MKSNGFGVISLEVIILLVVSFSLLMFSVIKNLYIGYPLVVCWLLFMLHSMRKGFTFKQVLIMSAEGGKKSLGVIQILLLIGAVISLWMSSGTLPSIIFYSLTYISSPFFLLSAFLICCIMSSLIGSSLGTVSTVGVPLIILARSGDINLNMVAGAIIAGAYFGDRCSPMSSSAALVANLTQTDLFINIKNMLRSSVFAFLLSLLFYGFLSQSHPLRLLNNDLAAELSSTFKIGLIFLIPAIIIIVLSLMKIKIQISMLISILFAFLLSLIGQKYSLRQIFYYILWGFQLEKGTLQTIIKGGGIFPMLKTTLVIYLSCSLTGVFEGIKMFEALKQSLQKMNLQRNMLFAATLIMSTLTAAFGCSQTLAIILSAEIMSSCYRQEENYRLSLDLENSGILVSGLIPWNIAALVPTTTLNVSTYGFIPYAAYLYLVPVVYFIATRIGAGRLKPDRSGNFAG